MLEVHTKEQPENIADFQKHITIHFGILDGVVGGMIWTAKMQILHKCQVFNKEGFDDNGCNSDKHGKDDDKMCLDKNIEKQWEERGTCSSDEG